MIELSVFKSKTTKNNRLVLNSSRNFPLRFIILITVVTKFNAQKADEMTDLCLRTAVQNALKGEVKNLRVVPSVAVKLLKLADDENAMITDLAQLIETEPALAIKVLSLVNSARYGLPYTITCIHRAVNLLGFSAVRQIALSQLFYQKIVSKTANAQFNLQNFWQHCLFVASLSKEMAIALKQPDPDLVYTAGLLHDIGKIVLETYGKATYSDFIQAAENFTTPITEQHERDFFGITHSDIGAAFCQDWQLPQSIIAVVGSNNRLLIQSDFKIEIAIVALANYIAWMQGIGAALIDYQPVLDQSILNTIDINQLDLDYLLRKVDKEMEHTQEFYGIEFPSPDKLRAALVKSFFNTIPLTNQEQPLDSHDPERNFSAHLTLPHQSLDPNEFIPKTLEAIQTHFDFDRTMLFGIDPRKRCLVPWHWLQKSTVPQSFQWDDVDVEAISSQLLSCARDKTPLLINKHMKGKLALLKELNVLECMVFPLTHQDRLVAVLYTDNAASKRIINQQYLSELAPIATELSIAITHARQYEIEKKRAQLDPLTKLFNKRMIDDFLAQLFQQTPAQKLNFAVGFVDIDNFKRLNDACGHQAGDDALKIVAEILRSVTRPYDFIARYGGEEFLFVLKDIDSHTAVSYAERIRAEIERRGIDLQHRFQNLALTASIGVSMYNDRFIHYTDMIQDADQAMYQAKHQGRNKVVFLNSESANLITNVSSTH